LLIAHFILSQGSWIKPGTTQTDFAVNLEAISKWLKVKKSGLHKTLRNSYKEGIDYQMTKVPNPNVTGKYGRNSYKQVLLTPDCFKRLCMRSKGAQAEHVRTYFIEIESLVAKYQQQFIDGLQLDIRRLANNQRHLASNATPNTGYIYILQTPDSLVRLGRTTNLLRRLKEHNGSHADNLTVLHTFRTDDVVRVEACVKATIKQFQYRKYKEFYQIDANILKKIISGCDGLQGLLKRHLPNKPVRKPNKPAQTGGYFLAIDKDTDQ
jgi:predicted GIY-YIG superfamily endonuclease/phage anti-repressor protein